MIRIEMEDGGVIELELYPDIAPLTAANFEKLAKEGFYDGLIFHRVISGFIIQGGDPTGTGMGGSKEKIKGEFEANGCPNALSHKRALALNSLISSIIPNFSQSALISSYSNPSILEISWLVRKPSKK